MEKLFSPWRSKYIESFKPGKENINEECLFCRVIRNNTDKDNFILFRGERSYVIMNLFPYNSGHLMIVPYLHTGKYQDIDKDTNLECTVLLQKSCDILEKTIHPHGFNIGLNIGRVSGAGIDSHIHYHIVPRWNGDTNFMPVFADVKLVSQSMEDTYEILSKEFKE